MIYYSPLRYPGGKNKLANFISKVCVKNNVTGHYIEPYAGGAAVALFLLFEGQVSQITINDKDRSIYAFWYSVLNKTEQLCSLIAKTPVDIATWREQKEVQKSKDTMGLLALGFSTFFLNRCNRSGIINGGPIGGIAQAGTYKIDCRFNKTELIQRIKKIGALKHKITLKNLDALNLIEDVKKDTSNTNKILYFDPPYFIKGESLYMNHYQPADHKKVARAIKSINNAHWIVSYDDHAFIRNLYNFYRTKRYGLLHTAHNPRLGKEILFISPALKVPKSVF